MHLVVLKSVSTRKGEQYQEGDKMANFSPVGQAEILLRLHDKFQQGWKINKLIVYTHVAFPVRADILFPIEGLFADLSRPFARAKNASSVSETGIRFSAQAETFSM